MKNLVCLTTFLFFFSFIQAQSCPIIIIDDAYGAPGDTVAVSLFLDDMPAFVGIQGTVVYDTSALQFIGVENGSAFEGTSFTISANETVFNPGQITTVGLDLFGSSLLEDFLEPAEIGKFIFVLEGQSETSSEIIFDGSLTKIELVTAPVLPISYCAIFNGTVVISDSNPPPPKDFEVSLQINNAGCNQTPLGSITAKGLFGVPPYTFSWTGMNSFSASGEIIAGLSPGLYNLTATDADGSTIVIDDIEVLEQSKEFELSGDVFHNICDDGDRGSIITTVTNNTGNPLSYEWSNGATTENLRNLRNGKYSLTVTDFAGCTQTEEYEINSSAQLPITIESIPSCENGANGSIVTTFTPNGYEFFWSNGATTPSLENLAPGIYEVTITEYFGCYKVAAVEVGTVSENSTLNINATCTSLGFDNGAIGAEFLGDLAGGPISFLLSDNAGNMLMSPLNLAAGTYSITATSVNGCEYSGETVIEESLSDFRESYFSCMLDSIQIETSSNNPDLLYSWSPAQRFSSDSIANPIFLTDPTSGSLTTVLTTSAEQGCTRDFFIAVNDIDNCVWPGDTNEDQMVSAADLLNIGLTNGNFGPARPSPGNSEWFTQPAILWSENIGTTSLNSMFADCNGDGVIDATDVLVVEQNEGLMHLSFTSDQEVNRNIGTPLFIDLAPNYIDGMEHDINIVLGDTEYPGANVYGLAFQIKYDPSITTMIEGTFAELGWMSEDGSVVWDVEFLDADLGLMDVAIVRTDGQSINGTGSIATFKSRFTPNNKNDIEFEIINAFLITYTGEELPVDNMMTTSVIGSNSTSSIEASLYNKASLLTQRQE